MLDLYLVGLWLMCFIVCMACLMLGSGVLVLFVLVFVRIVCVGFIWWFLLLLVGCCWLL